MTNVVSNKYTAEYDGRIMVVVDLSSTFFRGIAAQFDESGEFQRILSMKKVPAKGMREGSVYNNNDAGVQIEELLKQISKDLDSTIFKDVPKDEPHFKIKYDKIVVNFAGKMKSELVRSEMNLNNEKITLEMVNSLYQKAMLPLSPRKGDIVAERNLEYVVDDNDVDSPVSVIGTNKVIGRYLVILASSTIEIQTQCAFANRDLQFNINAETLSDVLLSDHDKECGCALVDIGAATTSVAIYQGGKLRNLRVLGFGGNILTSDINKVLCLSEQLAEDIKIKASCAMEKYAPNANVTIPKGEKYGLADDKVFKVKEISKIIQERLYEYVSYILGEIYYDGVPHSRKIVLWGGGSKMSKIKEMFESATGLDTVLGRMKPEYTSKYGRFFSATNIEDYAVCLGLLSSGFVSSVSFAQVQPPKTVEKQKKKGFREKVETFMNDIFSEPRE